MTFLLFWITLFQDNEDTFQKRVKEKGEGIVIDYELVKINDHKSNSFSTVSSLGELERCQIQNGLGNEIKLIIGKIHFINLNQSTEILSKSLEILHYLLDTKEELEKSNDTLEERCLLLKALRQYEYEIEKVTDMYCVDISKGVLS